MLQYIGNSGIFFKLLLNYLKIAMLNIKEKKSKQKCIQDAHNDGITVKNRK